VFGENAALLDISHPGATDQYGDPSVAGTVVWSGRASCTLRRRRDLNPSAVASSRIGGGGRSDIQTLVETDELIIRTATGINLGMVPGGRQTGWTVLVEDRRDPTNITQPRYTVRSAQLRAGATPGQSLSLLLGDGV
jgi:hypothetical protein